MAVHRVIIVTILTRYVYGQYGFYSSRGTRYLLHLLPPIERVLITACGHYSDLAFYSGAAGRETGLCSTLHSAGNTDYTSFQDIIKTKC